MASTWFAKCSGCAWVGFANERADIDRMAKDHVARSEKDHVVTVEPGPRRA